MTYALILITIILLALYFYTIGFGAKQILQLQMPHNIVLGMFTYTILFGIFTMPLAVLHVSWNLFFFVVTALNLVLLFGALYIMYKKQVWPEWTIDKVKGYFKSYWPVILLISCYLLVYLMNDFAFVFHGDHGAVWDHSYYAAKANEAIGNSSILQKNPKFGYVEDPMAMLVNSTVTWELFWSYLVSITGLTVNQISKIVMPPFIYIGVFFAFDIMFAGLLNKKKANTFYRGYILIFFVYILYTTAGGDLQGELKKFMYFPWYGNVQITLLLMLSTFYFFERSLSDKRWIVLLLLQLIFYSVFSAGAAMYAGLLYPPLMIYWLFKKKYIFKFDKIFVLLSLIAFVGLNIFYIRSQVKVPYIEQDVWVKHLNTTAPMFLLAGMGVGFFYLKDTLEHSQKFIITLLIVSIAILFLGTISIKIFYLYRFALHRYGVSLTLLFLMYGASGIIQMWKKNKKAAFIVILPCFILMQKNYDFYIQINKDALKPSNILKVNRESEPVLDAAQFLNSKAKEKQRAIYYCSYSNNAGTLPTLTEQFSVVLPGQYANIGSMLLTETHNVYQSAKREGTEYKTYQPSEFIQSNCDYVITDSEKLKLEYVNSGGTIEHVIKKGEVLFADVYIIDISKLKEDVTS